MADEKRALLRQIFEVGVRAVAPDEALLRHVRLEGETLHAAGRQFDLRCGRVFVLGGGKGVAPMAGALETLLGDRIKAGIVVAKYGHSLPLRRIEMCEAAHPVPDEAGLAVTRRMLELARGAQENDLLIGLFTGGASALTPAPAPGLSLADLRQSTDALLRSGADIHELNAIRKHLSVFSGGQLARAAFPASVLGILVSDVVGDELDVIASGPTAPDASTFKDCLAIVKKYSLAGSLPGSVVKRLQDGAAQLLPETPKPGDAVFSRVANVLAATNRQALEGAADEAVRLGFEPKIITDRLTGEARTRAVELVLEAKCVANALPPGARPVCLLAGGETTVTVRGTGRGGRNQEMALAAALEMGAWPKDGRVAALFGGTDGTDGPTDAAGGFALYESLAAIRRHTDPAACLANNASHDALKAACDLLVTGPTRTNVMDIAILLAFPPEAATLPT